MPIWAQMSSLGLAMLSHRGDISVFSSERATKSSEEALCIERIAAISPIIQADLKELWLEYEENKSAESRWVKVADRLLPFLMNISTRGRTWKEQGITRHQVLEINQVMAELHPELYQWLCLKIEDAVAQGWLKK